MKTDTINKDLINQAKLNIDQIVKFSLEHTSTNKALVVYDTQTNLSRILTECYRSSLPEATFMNFDESSKEDMLLEINKYNPNDLIVLIQSGSFLLNDFRIRITLFDMGLKVIEHVHLIRLSKNSEATYINSLSYDPNWYRVIGPKLQNQLANCGTLKIFSSENGKELELIISNGLELPKLNIGDYTGMKNKGGTFPIGEVFTEAKELNNMNGSIMIDTFATTKFEVLTVEPFRIDIKDGIIVSWGDNTHEEFIAVMNKIQTHETLLVREIGFGLNKAITIESPVEDITAFERKLGIHLSIGHKHSVYKKPNIQAHKAKFHVDIFPHITKVEIDDNVIFDRGEYTIL